MYVPFQNCTMIQCAYVYRRGMYMYIQWKLSNPNTLGAEESVLISEVS